ncbi:transglycosylase SLT domain-containing protein [Proteus myxofaciens]|uniref:peptidoglycan lytic exotransglycosylase n=1 Tax=Proteus myxofaciens ATCC 19692 TaxID=1354337 RepID=A0A198FB46_9GAMM|nr:transglycosylase SLT domain-containing protein [Proteus myxofaciens]OAT21614.1 membrane-bound lytic murein transglycosylase E [Proteus myxofaciens ATCC 19692]
MKIKVLLSLGLLVLAGCADKHHQSHRNESPRFLSDNAINNRVDNASISTAKWQATPFDSHIQQASARYNVDETLIKAIIQVESNFRPEVISKSNAVGLMQIKASTAGRDIYQYRGRSGQPTTAQLKDPATNIDLGTAYIQLLRERHLSGIMDPETLYYATILAYVNGAGALLRTFDNNRDSAIAKINAMSADDFYRYVEKNHPATQAPRYLAKVRAVYHSNDHLFGKLASD